MPNRIDVLLNNQLESYVDLLKFEAVSGSGRLFATACLACAHSEIVNASKDIPPTSVLESLYQITELAIRTEPPLRCSAGKDMMTVQQTGLYVAGPETPVTEICSKFKLRPMPNQEQ